MICLVTFTTLWRRAFTNFLGSLIWVVMPGWRHLDLDLVDTSDGVVEGGAGPFTGDDVGQVAHEGLWHDAGVDDKTDLGESHSALSHILSLDTILVGVMTLIGILDLDTVGTGEGSDFEIS